MNVAIIPARGGSKRIPRKNIRLFNGLPMMAYSIRAALASGCFNRVIVTTEDQEIAEIARREGAEVPFVRPADLCDDFVSTAPIIQHALNWLIESGWRPEFSCCLYATAPLVCAEDLRQGLAALQAAPEKQYAFSVTSFPFPIQRAIRLTADGGVEPFQPECIPKRSQDLEEAYHDAGQFYWGRTEAFLQGAAVFSRLAIPIILPRYRVQDIDTPEDWIRAELLHRVIQMAGMDAPGEPH